MTPRTYQSEAINTISSGFSQESSRVVLAAATGSGKTEMAIMLIDSFVKSKFGKVLVIAHHTNIIKDNFCDRLRDVNPDFSWSCDSVDVDCFVSIRQNIVNLDLSQFSLVIVDEAHQNYFAETVQSRINVVNHQVLLTATPSKFVADGSYDILAVARLDIPNEYYARLNFQIINADNQLDKSDYNEYGAVKSTAKLTINEMKSAVDSVMSHIKEGKKLFICRDIKHANVTAKYLTTLGIETFVSDSQSDVDGSIADSFKSGEIQSLVVVDRMRLGYSDNNLYYTVDLTFTHNADSIYQMMSRSNRGNQSQRKFYIKVTNDRLNLLTRVIVSASISLMKRENLLTYNGKNFKGIQIPVVPQSSSSSSSSKSSTSVTSVQIPDFGDVQNFFDVCDFVDSDDVLSKLGLEGRKMGYINYEYCLEVAKKYTTMKEFYNTEKGSYRWLSQSGLLDKFKSDSGLKVVVFKRKRNEITNEEIIEAASTCLNNADFGKKYRNFFNIAYERKITAQIVYQTPKHQGKGSGRKYQKAK
jgi:hypothetical protein